MSGGVVYETVGAKVSARKKVLLKKDEWGVLLDCKTIDDIATFLEKKYNYKKQFLESNLKEMHRDNLEIILGKYIVSEIEKMIHYFSASYRRFFKVLLMKYEIYDLQLILRELMYGKEKIASIEKYFTHSRRYSTLQYNRLTQCETISELIEGVKGTNYYHLLKTVTQEDLIVNAYHLEMKLYMDYYKRVMEEAKRLDEKDYLVVKAMIGKKIDLLNMQWIYRGMTYYDLSKEEIFSYSLQGGNIKYKGLKALIYTPTVEVFKEQANKHLGETLFSVDEKDCYMGKKIDVILYKHLKSCSESHSLACVLKYFISLEIQVDDLIVVIEGTRYQLPKEIIKNYLVHTTIG